LDKPKPDGTGCPERDEKRGDRAKYGKRSHGPDKRKGNAGMPQEGGRGEGEDIHYGRTANVGFACDREE